MSQQTTQWTTRAREPVGPGDLVALSILRHADALGRIIAPADGQQIHCVLIRGRRVRPGTAVTVEPDQLLVKVYE